jgi:hypothetical protein
MNPTKNGGELECSGRVSSSYSTSRTHLVNLVQEIQLFSLYRFLFKKSQFHRGGGQVCFQNEQAWKCFKTLVKDFEAC